MSAAPIPWRGKRIKKTCLPQVQGAGAIPRQVAMDEEMAREIRRRAEANIRTVAGEVLHLLDVGLQHDPERSEP